MTHPQLQTLGDVVLRGPGGEERSRRRLHLALLAVLACRAPAPVARAELRTLLWRDKDEERVQRALDEALAALRAACGDAVEVRPESVRLDPARIDVDVARFAAAARAKDWPAAVAAWTGEFLPRCEDLGIEPFRGWLEGERERLRRTFAECLARAIADATRRGDTWAAYTLASRWASAFPLDERASRAVVEAACAAGRVAEAVAARDAFVRRLSDLLGARPSGGWRKGTDAAIATAGVARGDAAAGEGDAGEAALGDAAAGRGAPRRRWLAMVGAAAAAVAALLLSGWVRSGGATRP